MKTKNILKMLAFAMLMPAMMLSTACSSDNDVINTPEKTENTTGKGYEIPITLNATRQDAATTRATYNSSTNKLEFSEGDQLFVAGNHSEAGSYSGILNWMGGITFSGTITTTNPYDGTAIQLLNSATSRSATLLPAGYTDYNYIVIIPGSTNTGFSPSDAFTTSKETAVVQFSREQAFKSAYNAGVFALTPRNFILNFTITKLTPNTTVGVEISYPDYMGTFNLYKQVTTDDSGNVTFAIGAGDIFTDLSTASLKVNNKTITLVTESTPLEPGHIYNITRSAPQP